MSVLFPAAPGGGIAASDSDSISDELNANGLPVGTRVWNSDVGAFFVLTASTASLVTDEILAVLDQVGTRWIIETGGLSAPITNADLATMATHTFKANVTAGTAVPADITRTQLTAELNAATTLLQGALSADDKGSMFRSTANLTDADTSLQPGTLKCSKATLPPATLTTDRILTLDATNSIAGDVFQVVCQDLGNHNLVIKDGAGTTIKTVNGATNGRAKVYQFYEQAGFYIFNVSWWA